MPFRALKASSSGQTGAPHSQRRPPACKRLKSHRTLKPNQGATFELPKKIPGLIFTAGGERSPQLFTMSLSDTVGRSSLQNQTPHFRKKTELLQSGVFKMLRLRYISRANER